MAATIETPITVSVERLPGSEVEMTIEVPAGAVDAAFERVLNRLAQRAKIEGFRPGKAPRALVEARIGREALREEVADAIIPAAVTRAMEQESIDSIDRPRVDIEELDRGRPGRFKARVSVIPEVVLPDLSTLEAVRPATAVDDEMVDRQVAALLDRLAEVEPVERPVQDGDLVVADVDVHVDGTEIEDERRRAMETEVKEGVLIPELRAAITGRSPGETVEVSVTMPADHVNDALAGRAATIRFTIQGVKEKRIPRLDDAVAARASDGRFQTALELRVGVRKDLEEQAARFDRAAFEQSALRAAVAAAQIEVPRALVDREVLHQLEDLDGRLKEQGLKLDRYLSFLGKTPEQWLAEARPDAEGRLRVDLVLEAIAKQEGIDPGEEEVLAYMQAEAARDEELAKRFTEIAASSSARRFFRHRLERARTLDRLMEQVRVVPPPAAPEEQV